VFGRAGSQVDQAPPAWGAPAQTVARWPAAIAVVAAIILYYLLPDRLISNLGPRLLVPVVEAVLLLPVVASNAMGGERRWVRPIAIALIGVVSIANLSTLTLLIHALLKGSHASGVSLLVAGANVWLTNVLVFGLWYWELDRGGPLARCSPRHREPDFLFPQMSTPGCTTGNWTPSFVDYLYVSFTNATAFSPTDTMPLTEWAKFLMMIQAGASLVTVGLVLARAVNILS
jgi:hypothetical protein